MKSVRATRLRAQLDSLKKGVGADSMVFEFENGQKLAVPVSTRFALKIMCCANARAYRILYENPEDPASGDELDPDFQRLLPLFRRALRVTDRSGEHGFAGTAFWFIQEAEAILKNPELKPNSDEIVHSGDRPDGQEKQAAADSPSAIQIHTSEYREVEN